MHPPAHAIVTPRRLLVVEDEPLTSTLLTRLLTDAGFSVEAVPDVVAARQAVKEIDPDVAVIDISLGSGPSGADLAYVLSQERPDIALLFLTRHPDLRTAGLSEAEIPRTPVSCARTSSRIPNTYSTRSSRCCAINRARCATTPTHHGH